MTIWEQQFGLLVNGKAYEVGPLQVVKEFGEKYLATTSKVSHSETAPILDEELILAFEDEVIEAQGYTTKTLEKFAFADNFTVAFVCGKCKRKITDGVHHGCYPVSSPSFKAHQRTEDCGKTASIKVSFFE